MASCSSTLACGSRDLPSSSREAGAAAARAFGAAAWPLAKATPVAATATAVTAAPAAIIFLRIRDLLGRWSSAECTVGRLLCKDVERLGQLDHERAAALARLHADGAPVGVDHLGGDRQAEPAAAGVTRARRVH